MPRLMPSELPVVASVRHHWIVMFRPPSKLLSIVLLLVMVMALVKPWPMALVFTAAVAGYGFVRWQTWQAEQIVVTQRRIVRTKGVPETTTTESSLRLDRISGAVLEQTVPGKLLHYATIELEAPGNHPDFRKLERIERPHEFYLLLRRAIFLEDGTDPDDEPTRFDTAPIPRLPRMRRSGRG